MVIKPLVVEDTIIRMIRFPPIQQLLPNNLYCGVFLVVLATAKYILFGWVVFVLQKQIMFNSSIKYRYAYRSPDD